MDAFAESAGRISARTRWRGYWKAEERQPLDRKALAGSAIASSSAQGETDIVQEMDTAVRQLG
jgi:hypothetical protein